MNFLKKNWLVLLLVLLVTGIVVWVLGTPTKIVSTKLPDLKLHVVASFYPLAEFARAVGGDLVTIETVTPAGVEPHDYEPTAKQIASIYGADVVLFNGGGVDTWATRLAPDVSSRGISVMEASKSINVIVTSEPGSDTQMTFDPHFWLDPVLAERIIAQMQETFTAKDPKNAEFYKLNAEAYLGELTKLDQNYKDGLLACQTRTIITSHGAFTYLAKQYGFDVVSIAGLSPEEEPSAGRLAEITKIAKQKQIKAIFFETLANPKLSQALASEIGAQTLVFNPLEGLTAEEQAEGESYLTIMRSNLTNLKKGMVCQ